MRSKTQGFMATLFMFVPLLAVPFVASFGVPWLAAKTQSDGATSADGTGFDMSSVGVGQSHSGRHSAADLFAPILNQAAVDLRLPPPNVMPPSQNPHLRNASLVVSHTETWVDPFENIDQNQQQRFQVDNSADGFEIAAAPAFPNGQSRDSFGPADAPAPQDFPTVSEPSPDMAPSQEIVHEVNPFAQADALEPPDIQRSNVPIEPGAFEDPVPEARLNRDPAQFDASRTLFVGNAPPTPPENPNVALEPESLTPNTVSNAPKSVAKPVAPLTWETARVRLNALGIKDYYLQPDATRKTFLFRCAFAPPQNPRVNRVFEAEASDPLEAVKKVLAQVEAYQQ